MGNDQDSATSTPPPHKDATDLTRIDLLLSFERHTIRGKNKMKMRMGLSLAVMLAMALGRIQAGQRDKMRSMTLPVVRAA